MKENHYNQGALWGAPEHFNRAQNFQESFPTLVTTCLCIKTLVLIPQSLTKAGILRDFSFHHTGIFSLLQLADQLWHWKWNPCSSGRKWSLNKWHEKQAPNSQTRTYRADKTSLERHSRQNKLSSEGLRPSRGWSRRWVLVQKQHGALSMNAMKIGVLCVFQNLNWVPVIGVGGKY